MSAAIERYEGERKAMLADVAHELRTPLAAMQLRLEALADGLVPFDHAEVVLLRTHVDLMGRLIDDLRTLSLADTGRLTLSLAEVELGGWLRQVTAGARVGLERRGVGLAVAAPAAPVRLRADPQRLTQVLHNLLDNASRYAPDGSDVDVTAEVDGGEVHVRVRDRGPGVPADELATIFERVVQGRRRDGRGPAGSGLGLAIVRTLVEACTAVASRRATSRLDRRPAAGRHRPGPRARRHRRPRGCPPRLRRPRRRPRRTRRARRAGAADACRAADRRRRGGRLP
jgi:two-component system, OmpR family, sensor histidine kinase BaeS